MIILPLTLRQQKYLRDHNLEKKYLKQSKLLQIDFRHPSLNVELLEPKEKGIYSFRLDIHYRVLFVCYEKEKIEIIVITNHYQ